MLGALERYLTKQRLVTVTKMAVAGHDQPRNVNGTVPDLEGLTEMVGQPVFGVAERCDTYASDGARQRIDALSRVRNAEVFVAVPAQCYDWAKRYMESNFAGRNITVLPYGKA